MYCIVIFDPRTDLSAYHRQHVIRSVRAIPNVPSKGSDQTTKPYSQGSGGGSHLQEYSGKAWFSP
jgi:hypothetical protein